jgi:hypothetical protein
MSAGPVAITGRMMSGFVAPVIAERRLPYGIFSGMISSDFPDADRVLADLGNDLVGAFIGAVDAARDDYAQFRQEHPDWFVGFSSRFIANFLHERIWNHLVRAIEGLDGIHVTDREPVRELHSGTTYVMRVKRHNASDKIAAYPTDAALRFWSNRVLTLDGLELLSLALGYYWQADLRAVGDAVLSFRDGKDNPIWAIRLQRAGGTAVGFSWTPVEPDLPEIDLSGLGVAVMEESGS